MTLLIRLLCVAVVVMLIACGVQIWSAPRAIVPLLPEFDFHDPVFEEELKQLQNAVRNGEPEARQKLADALLGQGFYAWAAPIYQSVLETEPQNVAAQYGVAFCLDRTGRVAESTEAYRRMTVMPINTAEEEKLSVLALYAIGRNFLRLEDVQNAEAAFRQNTGFPAAGFQLAKIMNRQNRAEESLSIIAVLLQQEPFSLGLHYLRAQALRQLGQEREAELALRMVERSAYLLSINFSTDMVRPLQEGFGFNRQLLIAETLLQTGETEQVEKTLEGLLSGLKANHSPAYPQALAALAEVALRNSQSVELRRYAELLQEYGENSSRVYEFLGAANYYEGTKVAAVENWEKALLITPNIATHRNLSDYYKSVSEEAKAQQHLAASLVLQGREAFRANQLAQADQLFQQAIEANPQNADAWFYHAEMNHYQNNVEAARKAYQKCLEIDQHDGKAIKALELLPSI